MQQMEHLPPLDLEPNFDPTERSGVRGADHAAQRDG